ncbi:UNVERIFIED_ORG: hypothetical protein ABIB19_003553 [Arthrobacter sp. UYEF10]
MNVGMPPSVLQWFPSQATKKFDPRIGGEAISGVEFYSGASHDKQFIVRIHCSQEGANRIAKSLIWIRPAHNYEA